MSVFPAYAGMILGHAAETRQQRCVPRIRGDDPDTPAHAA